jgi:hypothetical protein
LAIALQLFRVRQNLDTRDYRVFQSARQHRLIQSGLSALAVLARP